MYSRQEVSFLTQQFWTSFGLYISPVRSAEGKKINWINYKTGVKDIRFIMQADERHAEIAVILFHTDKLLQRAVFEKFVQLKKIFHRLTTEEWQWHPLYNDQQGKTVSRLCNTLSDVSILNRDDWPAIISFFKPRIILLDKFWCEYKYVFEDVSP